MLKDKVKGAMAGVLIGAFLSGGVSMAVSSGTLYNVITQGIKIVVDGQKINPKDANGNKVEPFIYNGTTYLPVRAIADALGKEVYWDGPNYTVYLGEMNGRLEYPSLYLKDAENIGSYISFLDQKTDNYGNMYNSSGKLFSDDHAEYLLNMKYSRLKGTIFVEKGTTAPNTAIITVKADGKTIYTSPQISKTSYPISLDLNIRGCNHLEIACSSISISNSISGEIYIADAGFYQ